ncbi:MAG: hypothetical protein IPN34_01550 [Planctomycetes bacterium]|nr:hypothetical protein [Planctomycetota bacterium]
MAKKPASKRGARGGVDGERWARRAAQALGAVGRRVSLRAWLLVLCAALLVGGFVGARHLTRESYAWDVFRVDPFQGIEVERPADAPAPWLAELSGAARRIAERGSLSIFSDADLDIVREEIARVPWVKRVDEIERRFPDRLYVRLEARKPVARVNHGDRAEWVDEEGVLLPPPSSKDEEALRRLGLLPSIQASKKPGGVKLPEIPLTPPAPAYGAVVRDARFRAACATAAQLAELGLSARLPAWRLAWIDSTEFDPQRRAPQRSEEVPPSEVVLYFLPVSAERQSVKDETVTLRVEWGEPAAHAGYEPARGREFLSSPELRLQRLESWVRANPDTDRSNNVTVRFGGALARPQVDPEEAPRER